MAMKWILKAFALTLTILQKFKICVLTAKFT